MKKTNMEDHFSENIYIHKFDICKRNVCVFP